MGSAVKKLYKLACRQDQNKFVQIAEVQIIESNYPAGTQRKKKRRFNVLTSLQRPYNVVLTSCGSWEKA